MLAGAGHAEPLAARLSLSRGRAGGTRWRWQPCAVAAVTCRPAWRHSHTLAPRALPGTASTWDLPRLCGAGSCEPPATHRWGRLVLTRLHSSPGSRCLGKDGERLLSPPVPLANAEGSLDGRGKLVGFWGRMLISVFAASALLEPAPGGPRCVPSHPGCDWPSVPCLVSWVCSYNPPPPPAFPVRYKAYHLCPAATPQRAH